MANRFWRKHKISVVFGVLVASSLAMSAKDIGNNFEVLSDARQRVASNAKEQMLLEETEEHRAKLWEIANNRMKKGCVVVVDARTARNLATIVEGQPILDRTTKAYLPNGTTVCDGVGTTAILKTNADGVPVATALASGDRELIYPNIKRVRGARIFYNVPKVGN